MNDYMISAFIDNELTLTEKIEFVERTQASRSFKDEAVELLVQEKMIRDNPVCQVPPALLGAPVKWNILKVLRPALLGLSVAMAAIIIYFGVFIKEVDVDGRTIPHRFIIYHPDISRVEITGSFTGWEPMPMKRAGLAGYWEIIQYVPGGEHRYAFILEGEKRIADPTVLIREKDDFGSENSILKVTL
ncbi:glycogen-binding domain-containing protein [Thermodesulfobacteriota bacterium]